MEDLRQVGGPRELFDEGSEAAEGLQHFLQVALRHKEQRLAPHQGQVALVEHIGEQVGGRSLGGFPIEAGSQSFHKLTVLLRVIAFYDGDQIVLTRKLAFHFQEVPMVSLVRTDEVVPVHAEFQSSDGVPDANGCEEELRRDEPSLAPVN